MYSLHSIKVANISSETVSTPLSSNHYIISSKHYFQYLNVFSLIMNHILLI